MSLTRELRSSKPRAYLALVSAGLVNEDGTHTPAGKAWVAAHELREAIECTTPYRCRPPFMRPEQREAVKAKLLKRFDRATLRDYCADKRRRNEAGMRRANAYNGGTDLHAARRTVYMEYARMELVEEALADSDPHKRFCAHFLGL